jgi:spore coat polysaccharide biosynthesis protein SpsF (cytidylyltransferase family)
MSSVRLPSKTLADIEGEPMLALLLHRLAGAGSLESIAVATSTDSDDDPIVELAGRLGIAVVRGPREDVLARYLSAIRDHSGPIVRVTGDCPLVDPAIVDQTVERFTAMRGCAYASNLTPRTFPDGLDVEVVDPAALRAIAEDPLDAEDREHVTSAIRAQPGRFPQASLRYAQDLGSLRWTVDEPADLEFVRALVRRLAQRRDLAGLEEMLETIRRPPSLAGFHGRRG